MQKIKKILLIIFACVLSVSLSFGNSSTANYAYPDNIKTYKITKEGALKLHIYLPSLPNNTSTVLVFFHGGGWIKGSPTQFYRQCNYFKSQGYICISVEYRTQRKYHSSPKQALEDSKSAMRYIRNTYQKHHKIIALGASAGGQLALATAFNHTINAPDDNLSYSASPDAFILFNPILDTSIKGYGYHRVKKYWQEMSPIHNIREHLPPTIIFLGTQDKLVPISTAKEFCQKMHIKGNFCLLNLFPGEKHGFFNHKKYQEVLEASEVFLKNL